MFGKIIEEDLEEVYISRNIPWEELEGKTILISGAYGMLASYLVFMLIFLNERKEFHINIIAIVKSEKRFWEKIGIEHKYPYIKVYESDLTSRLHIQEKVDYIIHAASLASPQYYGVYPVDVLMPNVIGSYHLLELAVAKSVRGYLLFSTGDIYGRLEQKEKIREQDYGCMDPLDIHNCYNESKRMAETMCKAWLVQKGVPVKIARIWHTYSPTMDIYNDPRVFSSFVSDIIHHRDIVMKSDGSTKRSFCYIADAMAAYFLILLRGKNGEAYNVCNTEMFVSIKELAEKLAGIYPTLGLKVVQAQRKKEEAYVENSVANHIAPDNTKLRQLGWKPIYNIEVGFKRVLDGFSELMG